MMHYPYLIVPRVTVQNVEQFRGMLQETKKMIDNWAHAVFNSKARLMLEYIDKEKFMTGKELCATFVGYCIVQQ